MIRSLASRLLPASDRAAAGQTLWMGAIMGAQFVGGLAQLGIAARLLGPEGFGVLAVIMAAAALAHGLISMPGGDAVTAFVPRAAAAGRPDEAARVLRFTMAASLGLSLVAYGVIAALAFTASGLLGLDADYAGVALVYGLVGVFMAADTETLAALRLAERVSWGLLATVAGVAARVGLLAAAWAADGGMAAVAAAHAGGAAVHGLGMFAATAVAARHAGAPGLLRSRSIKVPRDVVRFQIGGAGKIILVSLTLHMDTIVAAQFLGAGDVGLYRGARQILQMTVRPFYMIRFSVQAQYSKQWSSFRGADLRRSVMRFTAATFALAALGYAALAILREPIAALMLGDEFSGSASLMLIMLPGVFVFGGLSALTALPTATGRVEPSLAAAAASFAAYIAAAVWLTPRLGVEGAAWANAVHYFAAVPIMLPAALLVLRQSRRRAGAQRPPG